MTDQELIELVAIGERRGVEFKGPRSRTNRHQLAEVARAVLGMTNKRDGGLVLIGVSDNHQIQGLTPAQADTWRNADAVRASLASYADPFVRVDTEVMVIAAGPSQGRTIAILTIHEFETVPVLCRKPVLAPGGAEILRAGACYVRSNQLPATTAVADYVHFRELLDLAIEKGVREFLRRVRGAGIEATGAALATDAERFAAQKAQALNE